MTDNDQSKDYIYEGVLAGLKIALCFIFAFVLLGYSIYLAIFLAALGGCAGGFCIAWWYSKNEVINPDNYQAKDISQIIQEFTLIPGKNPNMKEAQTQRKIRLKNNKNKLIKINLKGLWFRKNK
jgi:hypothetical protein